MRTASKLTLCGAAASAFLFSLAAQAQAVPPESSAEQLVPVPVPSISSEPAPSTMSDGFAALDRDNDGVITPNEAERSEPVAVAFQRLDESRDGRLDLAEFAQLRAPKRAHN